MMNSVFILDVDGTITDGKMYYSKEGKQLKAFGTDDWSALSLVKSHLPIHFISADKKGFPITQRRLEEECHFKLDLVPTEGRKRWDFIRHIYPTEYIIFMGDGILDWYPLLKADYSITTSDALIHTKQHANYVTEHVGGNRAVAEACIHLNHKFCLDFWSKV